jgi:iron-sulfur cluster repair protein YtfE (RIC family)
MPNVMQALRDEHAALAPRIDRLRAIADALTTESATFTFPDRLDEVLAFLREELIPHANAEDAVLYPAVERAMGATGATTTMSRDHVEIQRLTRTLERIRGEVFAAGPSYPQILEVRRILYGLHTLINLHIEKEDEFYFPLLEATLTEAQAATLYAEMERAAAGARTREAEVPVAAGAG